MEDKKIDINNQSVSAESEAVKKTKKQKRIRSQFALKKGSYSVVIIALVLAVLILLNWLVSVLGDRFHLEFDMSPEKINSISEENVKFIEGIKKDVNITVCADEKTYASYMASYAEAYYGISGGSDYFDQTAKLVNKYKTYNDKIKIVFIDPQSSEFTAVTQKYPNAGVSYGDIIVSYESGENERYKKLGFSDIYELKTDDTYAAYGYSTSSIEGNNIETALTGAIAYCTSSKTSKVAIFTGHSSTDYSSGYVELLKANNIEVDVLSSNVITAVSDDYDAVVIMAPTGDFLDSELDAISTFLENGGKLSKGLLYFADSTCPSLPNLESFLTQWGITVNSGLLFETNANNTIQDDPMTMGVYPAADQSEGEEESFDNSIIKDVSFCLTGYNVPLSIGKAADPTIKVNAVMNTLDSTVIAPVGAAADWSGYTDADKKQYQSVIEAKKSDYNSDNKSISSYVYAFGSIEYIQSQWAENSRVSNKDLVLACTERATGAGDSGISFISKTITNESFAESVTAGGLGIIRLVFIVLIPFVMLAIGIVVYVKRRNA